MIVVYSRHAIPALRGERDVRVLNPRFFSAAVRASTVYVAGSYPAIEAAYRAMGVPVLPWPGRLPAPLPPPPRRRRRKTDPAPSGN